MANVLVIDDDPDTRELVKASLEVAGHKIHVAADGREGVQRFKETGADLVITDLFMPEQEGLETIKQLRIEFPELPIIAMSGKPTSGTMLAVAKRMGANALLQKPFLPNELLRAVEQAL